MNKRVSGFALPTVLVAGLLAMMVLLVALTASSGLRAALDGQYYQQIAREAAESGITRARECLRANEFISQWAGKTLTPGTNCTGGSPVRDDYLIQTDTMESTFVVDSLPASLDTQTINVTGIVKLKRSTNGSVWKTIEHVQKAKTSSEVGVTNVAFGYGARSDSGSSRGAFFASRTATGDVKTLGMNSFGQLGNGTTNTSTVPQDFILPPDVSVRSLYASFLSTGRAVYAVTTNGDLYASGYNSNGMLGVGHTNNVLTPQRASAGISAEKVAFVDNNSWATYVVTESGKVYSAGECALGVLGRPCSEGSLMTTFGQVPGLPTGSLSHVAIAEIVTDAQTTFVRTRDGRVYGWGQNTVGALGVNPTPGPGSFTSSVRQIGPTLFRNLAGQKAVKMAFDGLTLYIVREDGSLWAIGDNSDSQINSSATNMYTAPVQMNNVTGCNGTVTDVRTDRSHIAVLFADGHVCTAGWNGTDTSQRGWLGQSTTAVNAPLRRITGTTLYGLPSSLYRVSAIAVNSLYGANSQRSNNTFLVGRDGTVYGAGSNYYGQLGNGSYTSGTRFVKMQIFGSSEPARSIQSGLGTTVIYTKSNRVYTVGNNEDGQLGNGNTTNQTRPAAYKHTNVSSPIIY